MTKKCPYCKSDFTQIGLLEKLNGGYKINRLFLTEEMKVRDVDVWKEEFEENEGYFCPYCDKFITDKVPEWE